MIKPLLLVFALSSIHGCAFLPQEKTGVDELDALRSKTIISISDGVKKVKGESQNLRLKSLRSVAIATGISHGRKWRQKKINAWLEDMHVELATTFNFEMLLIDGVYFPSRIDEVKSHVELVNDKQIRFIRHSYKIATQPKLVLQAPTFLNYLYQVPDNVTPPNPLALPIKGTSEEQVWSDGITLGWQLGIDQANDSFEQDINLLIRDYTGLNRYFDLVQKRLIKPPQINIDEKGIVITARGKTLNVGDELIGISADPTFNHPELWDTKSETYE